MDVGNTMGATHTDVGNINGVGNTMDVRASAASDINYLGPFSLRRRLG